MTQPFGQLDRNPIADQSSARVLQSRGFFECCSLVLVILLELLIIAAKVTVDGYLPIDGMRT